jgi:SPP1 gp7 family putative phage head morphogenesis protein
MDGQISRVLAEGLAQGKGPMDIARAMVGRVEKIGITRARMIARTETIRAHAEASLNTYEEAGVMGVGVQAEFVTAQDSKVCEECEAAAENGPYSIDEARGMIPLHPNCRCAWVPIVENPREVRLR